MAGAYVGAELILRQEVMLAVLSQLCQWLEKCVFGMLWQIGLVITSLLNDATAGIA